MGSQAQTPVVLAVNTVVPPAGEPVESIGGNGQRDLADLKRQRVALSQEIRRRETAVPPPRKPASGVKNGVVAAPVAAKASKPFTPDDLKKPTQNWYVRHDPLDAFYYLYSHKPGDGKGASVTFVDDLLNKSRSASLQAFTSYVVTRYEFEPTSRSPNPPLSLSTMAIAPFVWANGNWTDPHKPSEKSALQAGFDAQFSLYGGGLFSFQDPRRSPLPANRFPRRWSHRRRPGTLGAVPIRMAPGN